MLPRVSLISENGIIAMLLRASLNSMVLAIKAAAAK
jgi:hypothetical protein